MDKLIIALNKVDLVEEVQPKIKALRGRFKSTKFGAFLPIVPVAAAPKTTDEKEAVQQPAIGVEELIKTILQNMYLPDRKVVKGTHFLYAIDHCFQIKGQGTVLTGTVLSG